MRVLLILALAIPLVLTGCREYVVNDVPPALGPPTEGASVVQLKGPNTVLVDQPYEFKAESMQGVRYDWDVSGPAGLTGAGQDSRFYRGIAQEPGEATVRVFLLDSATGRVVGFAEKAVNAVRSF